MCTAALTAPVASKIGVASPTIPSTLSTVADTEPALADGLANSCASESTLVMVNGVSWSKSF